MGIDYGAKRIGLAFADEDTKIATPFATIRNDSSVIPGLVDLCEERGVEVIVLGESKDFSGEDNPIMQQIRPFKKALEERSGRPVEFVPEFYTSVEARQQPAPAHTVDGSAAAIILQSYLDELPHEDTN